MTKTFKDQLGLTDGQKWMLSAFPVLLGGIMRIPMGMLADRFGGLVDQYPEPLVEIHPKHAVRLGVRTGDRVQVQTRRGQVTLNATVVSTIREDTVFIRYHWAEHKSVNLLTLRALDPVIKIPEYKVCACRVSKAS